MTARRCGDLQWGGRQGSVLLLCTAQDSHMQQQAGSLPAV